MPVSGIAQGSTATANTGYEFVEWTKDAAGTLWVSDDPYFRPEKDSTTKAYLGGTYYAQFKELDSITINYKVKTDGFESIKGATVSPNATSFKPVSEEPTSASLNIKAGYKLVGWTKDNSSSIIAGSESATSFTPEKSGEAYEAATYWANVVTADKVTLHYVAVGNGTVTPESESLLPNVQAAGSKAFADNGYRLQGWYDNESCSGSSLTTEEILVPTKPQSGYADGTTYYAKFVEKDPFTIEYIAKEHGSVDNSDDRNVSPINGPVYGSTASADKGYHFVKWTNEAGNVVSVDEFFKPEKENGVYKQDKYYAWFEEDGNINIEYRVKDNYGGYVNPQLESARPVTGIFSGSTATAYDGFTFKEWQDANGTKVSTTWAPSGSTKITPQKVDGAYEAGVYYAVFEKDYYADVLVDIQDIGDTARGANLYIDTDSSAQTVLPYLFKDNKAIANNSTYAITTTSDGSQKITFTAPNGSNVHSATAKQKTGYKFVKWQYCENTSVVNPVWYDITTENGTVEQKANEVIGFRAIYTPIQQYTLQFAMADTTIGSIDPNASLTVEEGSKVNPTTLDSKPALSLTKNSSSLGNRKAVLSSGLTDKYTFDK